MPGKLRVDASLDAVVCVGSAVEILREKRFPLRVRRQVLEKPVELLLRLLSVSLPPHRMFGQWVNNRVLILGRSTGVMAGFCRQSTAVDNRCFMSCNRMLIQFGR